jgi:hypothetical protein
MGVSISVSIPGLNIAPASSAIPEKLKQGFYRGGEACPTIPTWPFRGNKIAAIKWRQIGQPLSVNFGLCCLYGSMRL